MSINTAEMSIKELTDHYNGLEGAKPVKKFRDKKTAIKRIQSLSVNNNSKLTREQWLTKGMTLLNKEFFVPLGLKVPEKLTISVGFSKGNGDGIGLCVDPAATADNTTHMFVCPSQGDDVEVLQIVLHEMIHATVGCDKGHGAEFKKVALEFGMAGRMTSTYAEVDGELYQRLEQVGQVLGKYPHSPLDLSAKKKKKPKQVSPWVGFTSKNNPKYKVDANIDKVLEFGRPRDFQGDVMTATKPEVEGLLAEAGV